MAERSAFFGDEIASGLFSWDADHPAWRDRVRSAAYITARSVVLIDPMLPAGRRVTSFWKALDRVAVSNNLPIHVVLTVFYHVRSSWSIASRYEDRVQVWWPEGGREPQEKARPLRPGSRLPGGVRVLPTDRLGEIVLWIPRIRVLAAGDVILGGKRKPLRLCAKGWLPDGMTRDTLARALAPLRELPIEIVHSGHGAVVTSDAHAKLVTALDEALE